VNAPDARSSTFFAPHLIVPNVLAELEFCQAAFGAIELRRWSNADGTVHVAELSIHGAIFHLHEEMPCGTEKSPRTLQGTTSAIGLFVPDPDSVMKAAMTAGATELSPMQSYDYGYRQGKIADPAGHVWLLQKKI
jgi:PhnB protein